MQENIKSSRPTWAEIDLGAIAGNLELIRARLKADTRVLAVVKAQAYGHGLLPVAKKLIDSGADYLGVAYVDEAVLLRKALGLEVPILVLGPILPDEIDGVLENNLTQAVADKELVQVFQDKAKKKNKKAKIHVKVDTGMGRAGVWHTKAHQFIGWVNGLSHLNTEGIYTHFSSAEDKNPSFTQNQINLFDRVIEKLQSMGIDIACKHAANSMGIMGFKESHLNLVRPGLVIYGLHPRPDLEEDLKLKPAMSLKTKIAFLKDAEAGRTISYGKTYLTKAKTKIATLPIGYGDGYLRALSNKASCLIRGKEAPIVGTICMDHMMVDVGHIPGVKMADEVVLIGTQASKKIMAEDLATLANTIPYEIVCRISQRVRRTYKG